MEHGLGRRVYPDDRDAYYPMRSVLPLATTRKYQYWNDSGFWFDQGSTSTCVGSSWAHWLEDGPVSQKGTAPIVHPYELYREAVLVDEWSDNDDEYYSDDEYLNFGTSVRAAAKVLQTKGFIKSYVWAFTINDVTLALLEKGPVVVGTNWYRDMSYPDLSKNGLIRIPPGSPVVGGHAYLLNGVNMTTGLIRVKNSWGRSWGISGRARIEIETVERLLNEDGECCLAVEVSK